MSRSRSLRTPAELGLYRVEPDDTLSQAMIPPQDESPQDRVLRLEQQQEATRVSREIDESLVQPKRVYDKEEGIQGPSPR